MPDTNPQETLDTSFSEARLNRLEAVWLHWRSGATVPRWQEHLPADEEPCTPDLIFNLVQMDIECRIKVGLPALLAEPYFGHPRLKRDDALLVAERQIELIRWEYQQRWQKDQSARRAEYEAAFPEHANALSDLKPSSRCPRCHKIVILEETLPTLVCSDCDSSLASPGVAPFVAETAPPPATPFELDPRRYELCEMLGHGGMGEVYRCGDPALGRDLAIKIMKADLCGHADIERRFLREARITASLQHPGIVPIHNLGRLADGRLHYTMRMLREGRTFADILKEQAGKPERVPSLLAIFEKVCAAAAYAHSKRVIHRDLKPPNIMVGKFGEVQVLDWGLAKLLTAEASRRIRSRCRKREPHWFTPRRRIRPPI